MQETPKCNYFSWRTHILDNAILEFLHINGSPPYYSLKLTTLFDFWMCHLRGGAAGNLTHRTAHFGICHLKTSLFTPPPPSGKFQVAGKSDFSFVCWASQQRKLGGAQQGSGESCNDICYRNFLTKPLLSRLSADRSQGRRGAGAKATVSLHPHPTPTHTLARAC